MVSWLHISKAINMISLASPTFSVVYQAKDGQVSSPKGCLAHGENHFMNILEIIPVIAAN